MALATQATQLKNVSLDVLLLPQGVRNPATAIITAEGGSDGNPAEPAAAVGATSLLLDVNEAASPIDLAAGTSLSFEVGTKRVQVLLADDVTLTHDTQVNASCFPLVDEIPFNSNPYEAEYVVGLKALAGVNSFSMSAAPQEVDTTDTKSGFGMESELVRSDITFDISGIARKGDEGLYSVIVPVSLDGGLFGREIFAVLTYPDGSQHKGAAKVKNLSMPGDPNEVIRYDFQLQMQGSSYSYITPLTPE